MRRGSVLAVRLITENAIVGKAIGTRALDRAVEETNEVGSAVWPSVMDAYQRIAPFFEDAFLLVVDVKNVELARAIGERCGERAQPAAHHHCAKGIE